MSDAPVSPAPSGPGDEPAPYRSLYRRYRPQRFDEVRGQEHVTRALRNAVRDDKVGHAYLFSGPRGTGKTSTARILAMALNCESPVEGEPDGTCESCRSIRAGTSLDVHELDAASNRRLDEMRDLLSRVALGTRGRWKVYIVDEVHQLTPDASSALLKTLEEPPGHVVFVLATTDPQKVLPTIRSRTQHYEFRLLGADTLAGLLRDVNDQAALGVASEAIDVVVRRGRGSARDALSALDQVAAAGGVEDDRGLVNGIVHALAEHDPARVLAAVAEAVSAGRDPRRLASDLLDHLRNGFLACQDRHLVLLPDDAVAEVEQQARLLGLAGVVRALDAVGQAAIDMRESVDPRVTLEVALVRVAVPSVSSDTSSLLERIERLEHQVAALRGDGGLPDRSASSGPLGPQSGNRTTEPPRATPPPASVRPAAAPPAAAGPAPRGPAAPAVPGPAPAVPGPVPAAPRPALGAHRRSAPGAAPPAPDRRRPPGPGPTEPGPGRPAAPGEAPAGPGRPGAVTPAPAGAPPSDASGAPPRSSDEGPVPSRDELTKAWGDRVLPGLPPAVKAYVGSGRFVSADATGAVYAVADRGLLSRAEPLRGQVEAALAAHFGRPVPLRLVVDSGPEIAEPPGDLGQPDQGAPTGSTPPSTPPPRPGPSGPRSGSGPTAPPPRTEPTAPPTLPTRPSAAPPPQAPRSGPGATHPGVAPAPPAEPTSRTEEDAEIWNPDELEDAGPGLASPVQRLLEAFPGSKEEEEL